MPSKYYTRNFETGNFYHIYNRGANKQKIFLKPKDYQVFTKILSYFLTHPTGKIFSYLNKASQPYKRKGLPPTNSSVHLISYCLMPNHFHLLLKQEAEPTAQNSITNLMRRLSITYSMYFNQKYQHAGALFESKYKNVSITSPEQLLHLTKYIHKNPKNFSDYPYSSYSDFLPTSHPGSWIYPEDILFYFSKTNPNNSYKNFVEEKSIDSEIIQPLTIECYGSEP